MAELSNAPGMPSSDGQLPPSPSPSSTGDPLLDAERTVHELAEELGRMRTAAVLLETSQLKAEELLRATDAVVRSAGRFTDDSLAIIQRLQAIDLESRLGEVNRKSAETQELLGRQLDRLNEALGQLRERSQQDAGSLKEEVNGTLRTAFGQLQQGLQQQAEKSRDTISAVQQEVASARQEVATTRSELAATRKLTVALGGVTVVLLLVLLVVLFIR